MSALTTRQRDLLNELLNSENTTSAETLANSIGITPRQVKYDLKAVSQWLSFRGVSLELKPGVGIRLICSKDQIEIVNNDLSSLSELQLILQTSERQQLLALLLLLASLMNLSDLVDLALVSRTTIIKDLDLIESFFTKWGCRLSAVQIMASKLMKMRNCVRKSSQCFFGEKHPLENLYLKSIIERD